MEEMDISKFWEIISLIDQSSLDEGDEDEAVAPVVTALSAMKEQNIDQFQEYLAQHLYALDGQKWADEAGESGNSQDGFLYARCYVVAKGETYYAQVLNTPSSMPKSEDQWAESLLFVAADAWAEITGNDNEDYDDVTTVSSETGSNEAQW